jgi:glucosamine--fructose-6-phosphate aminotransferase (isomerizing)
MRVLGERAASADLAEATLMFSEASEAPAVVERQRVIIAEPLKALADRFRAVTPRAVLTLARGSSDHAATFARYLIETRTGTVTASASPSVGSLYRTGPDLEGTVIIAISQSGRSPDLLAAATHAQEHGALLVAMVNDERSPLAACADVLIPLSAGPERSVAATKSFVAALAASVHLVAEWTADTRTSEALAALPTKLAEAWAADWSKAVPLLRDAQSMYVVARGHGLGVAQEAALKLKETCRIHAEAFSSAELRHGPLALIRNGFPVVLFGQSDETLNGVSALARDLVQEQARVITIGVPGATGVSLPLPDADPLIAPILAISRFYRLANLLAVERGLDPDRPAHLQKITETL